MKVKQMSEILNAIIPETLGKDAEGNPVALIQEDLTGVVDLGKMLYDAEQVDNYVKKLVDRIGRVVMVDREYKGELMGIQITSWEYGSVVQKIRVELPELGENESWKLEKGQSYDPHVFNPPIVSNKFFNSKTTFEADVSYTDIQLRESFTSEGAMNAFISMIETQIKNVFTISYEALRLRTLTQAMARVYKEATKSGSKHSNMVVPLGTLYQATLAADDPHKTDDLLHALEDPGFLRYASKIISKYTKRFTKASRMYNIGDTFKFTPKDKQHLVLLNDFSESCAFNLQSDVFHNELVSLPNYDVVQYWQAPGKDNYAIADISKIKMKWGEGADNAIDKSNFLGVIFDHEAVGVSNLYERVKTAVNEKAEFTNYFYKSDAGYFIDQDEQMLVFTFS